MATKDKKEATRTTIEQLNEKLSSAEQNVEHNKKLITYSVVVIVILAALGLGGYYYFQSADNDALEAVGKADIEAMNGNDSIALKLYEKAAKDNSGKYANRAELGAALILMKDNKATEALKHLENYDTKDAVVGALAQVLKGDCYVDLKKYDDAINAYNDAISTAEGNKFITPFAMYKKSVVLSAQKKNSEAADVLKAIKDKYPEFTSSSSLNISELYEKAAFEANGKK